MIKILIAIFFLNLYHLASSKKIREDNEINDTMKAFIIILISALITFFSWLFISGIMEL